MSIFMILGVLLQVAIPILILGLFIWGIKTLSLINDNTRNTHAEVKAMRNKIAQIESEQMGIRRLIRQNMSTQQAIPRMEDRNVTPFTDE